MNRIFFASICILLLSCQSGVKKNEIPEFDLQLINNGSHFNTSKIPAGKPIVFVFFSTDCEHCQEETSSILNSMDKFQHTQFYFISIDPIEKIKIFNKYYRLFNYPNILVARDYKYAMPGYYKISSTPFIALYDEKKQLK